MMDNDPREPIDDLAALRAENAQMQARLDRLERAHMRSKRAPQQTAAACMWTALGLLLCSSYLGTLAGLLTNGFLTDWQIPPDPSGRLALLLLIFLPLVALAGWRGVASFRSKRRGP